MRWFQLSIMCCDDSSIKHSATIQFAGLKIFYHHKRLHPLEALIISVWLISHSVWSPLHARLESIVLTGMWRSKDYNYQLMDVLWILSDLHSNLQQAIGLFYLLQHCSTGWEAAHFGLACNIKRDARTDNKQYVQTSEATEQDFWGTVQSQAFIACVITFFLFSGSEL